MLCLFLRYLCSCFRDPFSVSVSPPPNSFQAICEWSFLNFDVPVFLRPPLPDRGAPRREGGQGERQEKKGRQKEKPGSDKEHPIAEPTA